MCVTLLFRIVAVKEGTSAIKQRCYSYAARGANTTTRRRRRRRRRRLCARTIPSIVCVVLLVVATALVLLVSLPVLNLLNNDNNTTISCVAAAATAALSLPGGSCITTTTTAAAAAAATRSIRIHESRIRKTTRISRTRAFWSTTTTTSTISDRSPFLPPHTSLLFSMTQGQPSSSSSSTSSSPSCCAGTNTSKKNVIIIMEQKSTVATAGVKSCLDLVGASDDQELGATSTSSSSSSSSSSLSFLQEWKHHDNVEFHYFSPMEACEIRAALLSWYHAHRRKLPWRGDAPPWDGSSTSVAAAAAATAGAAAAVAACSSKRKKVSSSSSSSSKAAIRKFSNKKSAHDNGSTPDDGTCLEIVDATTATTTTTRRDTDGAFAITAYGVWVSEIMLQQTRVEAVIDYWVRWMQTFPSVDALAAASEEQVNAHWAGLGFYRRARMLHQAAKVVVEQHGSELPRTVPELMLLPGIGRYTASAIASIAYHVPVPVVDGNVCRVLARLRGIANHIKEPVFKDKWAWTLAEQIVNANNNGVASASSSNSNDCVSQAGNINQAIMELGATYCSPSGTGMDPNDPLKDYYWSSRIATQVATSTMSSSAISPATTTTTNTGCQVCCNGGIDQALETLQNLILEAAGDGHQSDMTDETVVAPLGHKAFPLPPPKPLRREDVLAVAAISMVTNTTNKSSNDHERWLLVKRPPTGLLAGQWEFPSACIWTSSDDKGMNKKKKQQQDPPHFAVTIRRKALKTLLREIMNDQNSGGGGGGDLQPALSLVSSDNLTNKLRGDSNIHETSSTSRTSSRGGQKRDQDADPVVHVFSHVRHTMWIEQVQVTIDDADRDDDEEEMTMEWTDSTGRQARWMNQKDMQQVGVTSGVKKILAAVVKARNRIPTISAKSTASKTRAAKKQPAKKRQRKR
jgi:A/G-specific adenine glycosylase